MGKNAADFFMAKVDAEQSESHRSQKAQLIQYQNWLQALRSQVCEYLPRCAYSLSDPALIDATALLKLLITFKDSTWATYQADMAKYGHATNDSIRGIHDATMLCCMFGWVPPMRVSMLISLMKPHQKHQCLEPSCICPGNYLHHESPTQLAVSWHHHKTARKQGGGAISYVLPQELNTMFNVLLDRVNRKYLESKEQVDRTVFLSPTGRELSMSTWGHYFDKLVTKIGKRTLHSALCKRTLHKYASLLYGHANVLSVQQPCSQCHNKNPTNPPAKLGLI